MADQHFERALTTPQLCGPTADEPTKHGRNWLAWTRDTMFAQPAAAIDDFGDSRVFFVHDGNRCGETGLSYEQSGSGPTVVYIADDASDRALEKIAKRHGLKLDELVEFRDQWDRDIILATPGSEVHQ